MSGLTEKAFLDAMCWYMASQGTTINTSAYGTTSANASAKATADNSDSKNIADLIKHLETMQIKLDKTIEMINGNFKN